VPSKRTLRRASAAATTLVLGVGLLSALSPSPGLASSHREAPLVSADPQVDNTDLYAFVSPDRPETVTLVSSWIPFEEPAGGPNFYPWATGVNYDIRIDNDADAKADLVYRWKFTDHRADDGDSFLYANGAVDSLTDPNLLFSQTYDLQRIVIDSGRTRTLVDDAVSVPSNVGGATIPDFDELSDSGTVAFGSAPSYTWAGQSDDPFFLDLRVFDLLYGGDLMEVGDDTLAGFNVNTMALQVPMDALAEDKDADENPIVGVWNTASRRSMRVQKHNGSQTASGDHVQVSRLGNPLVNEVVIPYKDKDRFNASKPADDGQFLDYVNDPELARLLNGLYGVPIADTSMAAGIQRDDLISVFLTGVAGVNQPSGVVPSEQMRLNMSVAPCSSTCSTLGVIGGDDSGYPNGRRLTDDVIDISIQVVAGELAGNPNALGDGVGANPEGFLSEFPYVQYANSGSEDIPHP
jgi:hypothetical protein